MWLRWWHDEAVEASAEARKKLEASLRDAMPLTRTNLALGGGPPAWTFCEDRDSIPN